MSSIIISLLMQAALVVYSPELDTTYKVSLEDNALSVTVRKNPSVPLEMTDKDAFAAAQFTITFKRNSQNKVVGFSLDAGRVKNLEFNGQ